MITLVPSTLAANSYSVNWNHQQNHFVEGLRGLRDREDLLLLTDVTLACDGEFINAHKLVLSICSSFFRDLFKKNKSDKSNTIIILGNMSAQTLKYLLRFIYQGTVEIPSNQVDNFLQAGKMLKIEGLIESETESGSHPPSSTQTNTIKSPPESTFVPERRERPSLPVVVPSRRFGEPELATFPQSVVSGAPDPLRDADESTNEYGGNGDVEVIDFNVKSELVVQDYPGFEDTLQSQLNNQSVGEDSYEGSFEESYPIPERDHPNMNYAASQSFSQVLPPPQPGTSSSRPRKTLPPGGQRGFHVKRSLSWRYYEELRSPPKCAKCNLCFKVVKISSVGHLKGHLKHKHKAEFEQIRMEEAIMRETFADRFGEFGPR